MHTKFKSKCLLTESQNSWRWLLCWERNSVIIKLLHSSTHSKLPSTGLYREPVQCTFTSWEPVFLIFHFNVNLILYDVVLCHKDLEVKLWIHLLVSLMYATHTVHRIDLHLIMLQKTSPGIISSLTLLCQTVCSFSYIKNYEMNLIWFAVWCQMFDDQHFPWSV